MEKSRWTVECPCKSEFLKKNSKNLPYQTNLQIKKDLVGNFFYSKQGGIFQDFYFEENKNYSGPFIFRSPIKVFLDVNEICNLNCRECYLNKKRTKEQNIYQLKGLITDLAKEGIIGIQLLGGEPTIYPHIVELCRFIKSKGLKVELVSNGFNLPLELLKNLKGHVDSFCISIDGNEKTHNYLRRNNRSYKNAVESIRKLLKLGFQTEVVMSVNKLNYKQIPEVNKIIKGKGALTIKLMVPFSKESTELILDKKNLQEIKEICKKEKISFTSFSACFKEAGEYSFFGCPGGKIDISIDVEGNVFKCVYARSNKDSLGNVYKEPFKKIWEKNNLLRLNEELKECKHCNFRNRCGGFCNIKTRGR